MSRNAPSPLSRIGLLCSVVMLASLVGTAASQMQPGSNAPPVAAATNAAQARQLHVVVVAVPKFSIPTYNNSVLTAAFLERCDEIKTYFEQALGKENVKVDQYCTPELTSRESLRKLFSIEIPRFSANTVTLLFIMSHGESVQFQNGADANDVELITSDTRITDDGADADGERQFSSILVGSEMLNWLETAPRNSTLLTFLDFCHSGAAASLSTSLTQYLQQQYGIRSLVVSSSLPSDNTYKALFTQSLLDLWKQKGCMNLDTMPTTVFEEMKKSAPTEGSEGLPLILVQYQGPLCLGDFGGDHKLLFLYGGQDAEKHPFLYQIASAASDHKVIRSSILAQTFLPIPLDSGSYLVSISRQDPHSQQDVPIGTWPIDLSSAPTRVIWLDDSAAPAAFATFAEKAADVTERAGLGKEAAGWFMARSAAVYRLAGRTDDANRIEEVLASSGLSMAHFIPTEALQLESNPTREALRGTVDASDPQRAISDANGLKLLGDFKSAGTLLQSLADATTDPNEKANVAQQAYSSFVAAGDKKSAASIKRKFELTNRVKPLDEKNGPLLVWQGSQAAGIATSLGAYAATSND